MLLFLQHFGALLVGVFSVVAIVGGAKMALPSNAAASSSRAVTKIFAFGTGAFLTAVCLDFLPDAWESAGESAPLLVLLGALILWAGTSVSDLFSKKEQDLEWVACTSAITPHDIRDVQSFTPVSAVVLAAALSFHTFLEGAAVSFAFHEGSLKTLGFALAIVLHKLPEGVLWGLALAAFFPRNGKKIRGVLFIPAGFTFVGVVLGMYLANAASSQVLNIATGLVAGAMVYIAFSELLPTLRSMAQPRLMRVWFVAGLVVMYVLNSLSSLMGG